MTDSSHTLGPWYGRPERASLNYSVELLRFMCAVAIAGLHMHPPAGRLLVSPLPVFLILASYFAAGSFYRSGNQFLARRLLRLARPWLAWSTFYTIVLIYMSGDIRSALIPDSPFSFLIGPTIHLWFLPFMMLVTLLVFSLTPRTSDPTALYWIAIAMVPVAVVSFYMHGTRGLPAPLDQWSLSIPSVCYGILASLAARSGTPTVPAAFVVVVAAASLGSAMPEDTVQLIVAVLIFEVARMAKVHSGLIEFLGNTSFGIYLVHPFFMLVYYKFFPADVPSPLDVVAVVAMSMLATLLMLQMPILRRLV